MSLDLDMDTGSYAGNDTGQTITVGWQPALIVIISARAGGPGAGRGVSFKVPDMPTGYAMICSTASNYTASAITITSTGFTVGAVDAVNNDGTTFYYVCFRDRFAVDYGTYTGDGESTKQHTTERAPSAMMVFQTTGTIKTLWKNTERLSTWATRFLSAIDEQLTQILLSVTSWWSYAGTNEDAETYFWIALYNLVGSTQHSQVGTYTGGGSSQAITLGFQAKYVFVWNADVAGFKTVDIPSSSAGILTTGYTYTTGVLWVSTVAFTVADSLDTLGNDYYWIAGRY